MADAAEHLITRLKLLGVSANRFDPPCHVSTESRVFGFEQSPAHHADQEYVSSQEVPVICIDGRRMNPYQDFILLRRRFFHVPELKKIRRSVPCMHNGLHEYSFHLALVFR
jgi:hypothetical protein